MTQERIAHEEATLERETTPVFSMNRVEDLHAQSEEKLGQILAGAPEASKSKYRSMLSDVRGYALALALLGNIGNAEAQEAPKEKLDGGLAAEQTVPAPRLPEMSVEQTITVTGVISHELTNFVEGKKASAAALTDSEKGLGQKLDAGIDLVRTLPGIAKKIPGLPFIEQFRNIQDQLEKGASVKDIAMDFLGAAISAKTWGASDMLRDYLQSCEENRKAKGLPDITYNPHTQQAP